MISHRDTERTEFNRSFNLCDLCASVANLWLNPVLEAGKRGNRPGYGSPRQRQTVVHQCHAGQFPSRTRPAAWLAEICSKKIKKLLTPAGRSARLVTHTVTNNTNNTTNEN